MANPAEILFKPLESDLYSSDSHWCVGQQPPFPCRAHSSNRSLHKQPNQWQPPPPPILYGVLPSFLPVGHPAGLDGFVGCIDLTYLRDSLTNIRIRVLSPGRPSFSTPPLICHTAPPPIFRMKSSSEYARESPPR